MKFRIDSLTKNQIRSSNYKDKLKSRMELNEKSNDNCLFCLKI